MSDAATPEPVPVRIAYDIAKQHGAWGNLRDAANAWNDLMAYAQDMEHRELALQNQLATTTRERDEFMATAAGLEARLAEAMDDLRDARKQKDGA